MKITVITVCRNSAATLQDTLESVLAQSWTGYEYLVVDGGSTDGTLEMLQDVEERFHGRLKWISEPDNGIYDAMNKGVRMSSGDVVGFLNADDYYQDNGVLETIAGAFAQHGDGRRSPQPALHQCGPESRPDMARNGLQARLLPARMVPGAPHVLLQKGLLHPLWRL